MPSISESFQADEIDSADVTLSEGEEQELQHWLLQVLEEDNPSREDAVNLAGLAFVAGRCYQAQFNTGETVQIDMDAQTLRAFLKFLVS